MRNAVIIILIALLATACTPAAEPESLLPSIDPKDFCVNDIVEVQFCDDGSIKTVHGLLGGGATWIVPEGRIRCPIVAPDAMSAACKELMEHPPACTVAATCDYQVPTQPELAPELTVCEDPRPEICTMEYAPVCGQIDTGIRCVTEPCPSAEWKTYGNACSACGDAAVIAYRQGECQEPIACPEGKDGYASQTGPACVTHYGRSAIGLWDSCETGKDCAKQQTCVYALTTTTGEAIDWSGSKTDNNGLPANARRCVPDDYGKYLLHTTGVTMIDADGRKSTAIA